MLDKLQIVRQLLFGFDYSGFFSTVIKDKLSIILRAEDFILGLPDGKMRFICEVTLLGQTYALSKPHKATVNNAEEIALFGAIKARLTKFETGRAGDKESYETVIKNIVDTALYSEKVVDIFDAAGLAKPEISILSEDFLLEIQGMKYKNIAIELLKKLLADEIKIRTKHNITKSKSLMDMLDGALKKYRTIYLLLLKLLRN